MPPFLPAINEQDRFYKQKERKKTINIFHISSKEKCRICERMDNIDPSICVHKELGERSDLVTMNQWSTRRASPW